MSQSPAPITVLHVDDDPQVLDLARTLLEREADRIQVRTASGAADGLSCLHESDIDCIVSDYDMPGKNGIEFLDAVRAEYPDLPFVLFTGKGSEEIASRAISAGVTDYLQKGGTEQYTLLANRIRNAVEGRRAKAAAQQHRGRLDSLTTAFPDVAFFIDEDGTYREVLAGPEDTLLYDAAVNLEGNQFHEVLPTDLADRFLETVQRTLDSGERETIEYELDVEEGTRWFEAQVSPASAPNLDRRAVVWVARDITDRKRREEAVEQARSRMETALEVTDAVVWDADIETEEAVFYPSSQVLYGTEISSIEEFFAQIHPDDRDRIRRAVQESIETGAPYQAEFRIERAGETRWIKDYGEVQSEDGEPVRITGVAQDVTAEKDRQASLERDRERLSAVFDAVPHPITEVVFQDGEPVVQQINDAFEETFGYPEATVQGRSLDEFIVPGDLQDEATDLNRQAKEHRMVEQEVERITASGERRDFLFRSARVFDDDESHWLGTYIDITERKERKAELERQAEQLEEEVTRRKAAEIRYRSLFENNPVVIWEEDFSDAKAYVDELAAEVEDLEAYFRANPDELEPVYDRIDILDVNETAIDYYDATSKAELLDGVQQLMTEESRETNAKLWASIAAGDTAFRAETTSQTLSGERRHELMELYVPEDYADDYSRVYITGIDITERKERKRELERQNERLDQFASLVAHDLRNPVNVARGQLELARQEVDNEHLDAVAHAHERTEALIEDLLTLARSSQTVDDLQPVDLATLCETCWESVGTEQATLVTRTDRRIRADRDRLRQLLENILRNAVDHGDGSVTVTLGALDGGFYVADDGPGIPDDERDQIFESGYSTSDDGYGLGLAITDEIVDAHGWDVTVTESDAGGARFEITGVDVVE